MIVFAATALILLFIGLYCVISKRNMIKTVIGIEIITTSVNLNFISLAFNGEQTDPLVASIVLISIAIGAAIAAFALSLIINAFKQSGSASTKKLRRLRW
ncbi:MAG: NADH-quinone oxidoreductase subunit K [Candidatus Methanomethylicus sp.]|nr:NADH-quinone oxidoreductase subunit K [Candidatus Methanomethylicus sp.]